MSSIPEHLQQDLEYVHDIIRAQKMGVYADVQEPIPFKLTRYESGFRAYETAFLGWITVQREAEPSGNVVKELQSRFPYIMEENRKEIAVRARNDLQEIDFIDEIVSQWETHRDNKI
jgi:hypothetical protein